MPELRVSAPWLPTWRQDVVMAMLKYVWFWPNGGPPDGFWGVGRTTPAEDAFARTSRRVTERYSEALETFGIEARREAVQMLISEAETDDPAVVLDVHLQRAGGEVVRAYVPPGVAGMSPQNRARLVLEVVDAAMLRIGHARGWPEAALRNAKAHALDHGLAFDMSGAWKSNSSRNRVARHVVRITDDGWSELSFEVAGSRSGDVLGFTRTIKSPLNSLPKFARSARDFRWSDNATIERPDDWQPRYGSKWGPVDTFNTDDLHEWPQVVDPAPADSPLPVEVRERIG